MRTSPSVAPGTLVGLILLGLLTAAPAYAQPPAASRPDMIPEQVIQDIQKLFQPPEEKVPEDQAKKLMMDRMQEVLDTGDRLQLKYPDAVNLFQVQLITLRAADFVRRLKPGSDILKQERMIAQRVVNSPFAPLSAKVQADFIYTMLRVKPDDSKPADQDAPDIIANFISRYAKSDSAGQAYLYGTVLAERAGQNALKAQYIKLLKQKYLDNPEIKSFLKEAHEYTEIGKPFVAKLTRLDGTGLTLPRDLKGKVLVVDFWATWCPPCLDAVPYMKQLYAKYKDAGVEFVGISLDKERDKLMAFMKAERLPWIQTYSNVPDDPTAIKYGITRIPTIFVVGKDGRIVSDDAAGKLEQIIQQALGPRPTSKP